MGEVDHDMEIGKVADMGVKIPTEDFTDVTFAIGDTYGDDVRGGNIVIMEYDKVAETWY